MLAQVTSKLSTVLIDNLNYETPGSIKQQRKIETLHGSKYSPAFKESTSHGSSRYQEKKNPSHGSRRKARHNLRHNSFSNPSVALPTSQLILQSFRCFIYVTVHSPTLFASPTSQALHLIHLANRPWIQEQSSFSKISVTSPTSQLILIVQAFRHFTYVTSHSPTLPSLYLRHNSFSNPSVASPMSQLILQPFFRF